MINIPPMSRSVVWYKRVAKIKVEVESFSASYLGTETGNDIIVYTVKRGDSLWKLARDYNTTINDIKQLNNLKSDVLRVGDELQIKKNTNV